MATTITTGNYFKYKLGLGDIELGTDSIIAILLDNTYTFDPDTDDMLSDITADQLATGDGYTQDNKALANMSFDRDDANDRAVLTCDDISWSASGGDIGPFNALVLVDFDAVEDTEFFTTEKDRTFAGGSTHWTNVDFDSFNDTDDLSLTADTLGQYCKITFTDIGTALVAGGRYQLSYDYTEGTAGFEFRINGAAEQTLGDAVAGTSQTIEFIADESFTGAHELRIYSKTNAAASGDFDNFSLKEMAAVIGAAEFDPAITITDGLSHYIRDIEVEIA
jgi:hypothetical protein